MTKPSIYIKNANIQTTFWADLYSILFFVCQIACSVLVVYFCWYVEAFGNLAVVVNGSFVLMSGCLVLICFINKSFIIDSVPYGIMNNFVMVLYCFIIGIFVAYDQADLFHSIRQYFIYAIIMYTICFVSRYKGSYDWFLKSINIATIICCIHLVFWGHNYSANRIVLSSNSNPNLLGTILNLGLFVILYRTQFNTRSLVVSIPQVCFVLYNIIMTGSRKSFIVAVFLVFIWGYSMCAQIMRSGNSMEKAGIVFIIICAALVSLYLYNSFIVNTAVFDRMQTMDNEKSNSNRIEMYKEALQIFSDKPLFGGGLEQYKHWSGRGGYSHSTYAESIADFGFVGSIIYFAPFLFSIVQSFIMAIFTDKSFRSRFVLGYCLAELFLGVGQIWFFDISHFFAWTIIFLIIQEINNKGEKQMKKYEERCRYVKY